MSRRSRELAGRPASVLLPGVRKLESGREADRAGGHNPARAAWGASPARLGSPLRQTPRPCRRVWKTQSTRSSGRSKCNRPLRTQTVACSPKEKRKTDPLLATCETRGLLPVETCIRRHARIVDRESRGCLCPQGVVSRTARWWLVWSPSGSATDHRVALLRLVHLASTVIGIRRVPTALDAGECRSLMNAEESASPRDDSRDSSRAIALARTEQDLDQLGARAAPYPLPRARSVRRASPGLPAHRPVQRD